MHHGYYESNGPQDHRAAQVAMIDRSLEWAYGKDVSDRTQQQSLLGKALSKMRSFIDVGCGVGGSSRHIFKRYARPGCKGVGISLSPNQVERARKLTKDVGLPDGALNFEVADALNMPFRDNSFDLGELP